MAGCFGPSWTASTGCHRTSWRASTKVRGSWRCRSTPPAASASRRTAPCSGLRERPLHHGSTPSRVRGKQARRAGQPSAGGTAQSAGKAHAPVPGRCDPASPGGKGGSAHANPAQISHAPERTAAGTTARTASPPAPVAAQAKAHAPERIASAHGAMTITPPIVRNAAMRTQAEGLHLNVPTQRTARAARCRSAVRRGAGGANKSPCTRTWPRGREHEISQRAGSIPTPPPVLGPLRGPNPQGEREYSFAPPFRLGAARPIVADAGSSRLRPPPPVCGFPFPRPI